MLKILEVYPDLVGKDAATDDRCLPWLWAKTTPSIYMPFWIYVSAHEAPIPPTNHLFSPQVPWNKGSII